jgi:hypothetical protein
MPEIIAKPKSKYKKVAKDQAPFLSFGVGSGAGALAASKLKGKRGRLATLALPILGGAAGYGAGLAATKKKPGLKEKATFSALAGGAAAVSVFDRIARKRKFKYNPVRRNVIGSAGGLAGAMLAAKLDKGKK